MNKVRTRLAPSPTGYVHIGSLQKILYSYAFAKKNGGDYLVRIEDTDQSRLVEGAEQEIYEAHKLLGIKIDESPEVGGKFGPYKQSERLDLYKKYADELLEAGHAYYAFETPEELEKMREEQRMQKQLTKYRGQYRDYPLAEAKKRVTAGEKYVIRIKLPENEVVKFTDLIMGDISVNTKDLDDYILMKSDGFPTYHLASLVDDHLMEISHVFRGVEWLPTAPIYFTLFKFMGWQAPAMAHIPNVLDPNGGKLSKRKGNVALMEFLKIGYLPGALENFIMLLGWSSKTEEEIFSLEEFVERFDLKAVNKGNPIFNTVKLDWFNHKYLQAMPAAELTDYILGWQDRFYSEPPFDLKSVDKAALEKVVGLEKDRLTLLNGIFDAVKVVLVAPSAYELEHKAFKDLPKETMVSIVEKFLALPDSTFESHETWEQAVRNLAEELQIKAGSAFMTLRIGILGVTMSPPLWEVIEIIGIVETRSRLEKFVTKIQ